MQLKFREIRLIHKKRSKWFNQNKFNMKIDTNERIGNKIVFEDTEILRKEMCRIRLRIDENMLDWDLIEWRVCTQCKIDWENSGWMIEFK